MLNNLSFSVFKAHFAVVGSRTIELPPYAGSVFRGVLGHAMRRVRYGRKAMCPECVIRSECRYQDLYAYLFESPADHPLIKPQADAIGKEATNYPQPFVLEPPEGAEFVIEEVFPLSFTLVGRAIAFFPFFVCALEEMGKNGIGKDRGKIRLLGVTDGLHESGGREGLIYNAFSGDIVDGTEVIDLMDIRRWAQAVASDGAGCTRIRIGFLTPFRFRYQERLGADLSFSIFMRNVFRRLDFLSVHSPMEEPIPYGELLEKAENVHIDHSRLEWADWRRFSSRQQQHMNLGGLIGDITFSGELGPFLPYIKIGEYLHIGKAATFGLGRYGIEINGG